VETAERAGIPRAETRLWTYRFDSLRAKTAILGFITVRKEIAIMKTSKLVILILAIATALFIIVPHLAWAGDDGAGLYKAKCAACHGADLAGRPAAKIPSLVSADAKKASDADLTDMIANGGKDKKASHAFQAKGLSPDQIKLVLAFIREQQKAK